MFPIHAECIRMKRLGIWPAADVNRLLMGGEQICGAALQEGADNYRVYRPIAIVPKLSIFDLWSH